MEPSLVMWPTKKIGVALSFAKRMSSNAHSLIWDTLPGPDSIWSEYKV